MSEPYQLESVPIFRNIPSSQLEPLREAAVRQAELDLQFTELRAPVTGRIGDRRVAPGNLVTGGTTGTTTLLATIVSIDPIRFEFTADEGAFIRYERLAKSGNDPDSRFTSTPEPGVCTVILSRVSLDSSALALPRATFSRSACPAFAACTATSRKPIHALAIRPMAS